MTLDVVTLAFAFAQAKLSKLTEPGVSSLANLKKSKNYYEQDLSNEVAFAMVRHWPDYDIKVWVEPDNDSYTWKISRRGQKTDQGIFVFFYSKLDLSEVKAFRQTVEHWATKSKYTPKVVETLLFPYCKAMIDAYAEHLKAEAVREERRQLESRKASMVFPPPLGTIEADVWLTAQAGGDFKVTRFPKNAIFERTWPSSLGKLKATLRDPTLTVHEFTVSDFHISNGTHRHYECVFRKVSDRRELPEPQAIFSYAAPSLESLTAKDANVAKTAAPKKTATKKISASKAKA